MGWTNHRPVLDREVTLQAPADARDAFGETITAYVNTATVPCAYAPVTGREVFSADRVAALGYVKFTIRYRSDVNAKWRAVFEGVTYHIKAPPVEIGRKQWQELYCMAVDP